MVFHPRDKHGLIGDYRQDLLTVHRVLRRLRMDGGEAFLTKGDNAPAFDPLVLPEQIVGRVTRTGRRDLRRPGWVRLGRCLAFLSYAHALFWHRLPYSAPDRLLGWLPRWSLRRVAEAVAHPFDWNKGGGPLPVVFRRLWKTGLGSRRIRIRPLRREDAGDLARLWNDAAPAHRTTAERLRQRLLENAWAEPALFLAAERNGVLLGAGLARVDGRGEGRIDLLFSSGAGRRAGTDRLLFDELLLWLKGRRVPSVVLGPVPEAGGDSVGVDPLLAAGAGSGFYMAPPLTLMALRPEAFRRRRAPAGADWRVRPWESADAEAFRERFSGDGYFPGVVSNHLCAGGKADRICVGVSGGRPIGLCQWLTDEEMVDYRQVNFIWALSRPGRRKRCYGFHLVLDAGFRGQTWGMWLTCRAIEAAFEAGVGEMVIWATRPGFYRRIGFEPAGQFLMMRGTMRPGGSR